MLPCCQQNIIVYLKGAPLTNVKVRGNAPGHALRSWQIGDFASSKCQIDFASIGKIQDLCKSKLYPTTGRLVKKTATWYARSSKTQGRGWCRHNVGKSTDYEVCVNIKMNRRRGEEVEQYDIAVK